MTLTLVETNQDEKALVQIRTREDQDYRNQTLLAGAFIISPPNRSSTVPTIHPARFYMITSPKDQRKRYHDCSSTTQLGRRVSLLMRITRPTRLPRIASDSISLNFGWYGCEVNRIINQPNRTGAREDPEETLHKIRVSLS